ncbi:hypothetical protein EV646_107262 [Kribbella antiqua]|uniref:Uncharacterized protein n=1 Tax=Kribbella antiqua TaxID=2512217 RepID=A0A4R2IQH7_9ACTN|nr:hypothetical protein [Kribbella antiqua]TCO46238.1 hypothetical protein EV646_107262 [Kribbella antiqua]
MRTSRKALALVAVLALAGCGNAKEPAATGDQNSDKSPLAEYMGEGFSSSAGGGMRVAIRGGEQPTEAELAKQRKVEDATAACMKAAGFEYVAVPPDAQPKSKFNDAFNLPADKFAQQYGYGISTIDWSKAMSGADDTNPNTKIRNALSPKAQKAYDVALNGPNANGPGAVVIAPKEGSGPTNNSSQNLGCRGKAAEEVYGKNPKAEMDKYESLFKDIEALMKRIESDQRVVDATSAWSDCLADAGHSGFKKIDEPRQKVSEKLGQLTGNQPNSNGKVVKGPPSFDKVDAAKLADLRKFEIALATDDQKCRAKVYDDAYKKVQYELEKEFVTQHKAELEAYRDGMASR